jgi:signal transduction histidine kinase
MSLGLREPVMIPPFHQNGHYVPHHSVISVALAPIFSPNTSNKEKNKAIAYLGFLLDPADRMSRITQLGRLGKTGETYAFDQAGYLVTRSRFENSLAKAGLISPGQSPILLIQVRDPEVNLVAGQKPKHHRDQQPFTKMAQSALQHQTGFNLDGYRDYRGVQVVGAWLWDSVLNLGLVTEIDVNEAYRSFYITETLIIAMLCLTIIAAVAVEWGLWMQSQALIRTVDSLENTRQKLQESVQARNEFISIAAHELRTPLTSLRLQFNLIRKLTVEGTICNYPQDKLIRITGVSAAEIERFSKIIRNLLEVSQASRGGLQLDLQEFDWMKAVQDIGFQYSQQLEQNGCKLAIDGPTSIVVRWDRSQMEQVLTNLLSNAIKFGKGKPIVISISEREGEIEVSVLDHGVGIKQEDMNKVFDKFERAGAINPEGGLGLGLYLVRTIVHRHHGTVHVKSTPGGGSTFTFRVPRILRDGAAHQLKVA